VHRDPYRVLRVPATANETEIRAAYCRLAREHHPDVNPSLRAKHHMQQINWAYTVLSNPSIRAEYDMRHGWGRSSRTYTRPHSTVRPKQSYTRPNPYQSTTRTQSKHPYAYEYQRHRWSDAFTREQAYKERSSSDGVFGGVLFLILLILFFRYLQNQSDASFDAMRYRANLSEEVDFILLDQQDRYEQAYEDYLLEQYYAERAKELSDYLWDGAEDLSLYNGDLRFDGYSSSYDDYDPVERHYDYDPAEFYDGY